MHTELQSKARRLYFQTDLTKTEIAQALCIPRRTLHHWIKEQNWEYQKQCATHMPVLIAEKCYHILSNFTDQLLAPDRKDVMVSPAEVSILYRLTTAISKLKSHVTLNQKIEVLAGFADTVNSASPEMAKALAPFIDKYIVAGAAASTSVPVPGASPLAPAQLQAERQLDMEHDAEGSINYAAIAPPRPMVAVADRQQTAERRQSPPPYTDFLAHLRSQDENIRHMFPVNTRYTSARAA
jgi:hypothetical protein